MTPQPPYTDILKRRRADLALAYRAPSAPAQPLPPAGPAADPTPQADQRNMLHIPFQVAAAGDNVLIPTLIGRKHVYELFLYNAGAAQTIQLYQGPSITGTLLLRLADFPITGQLLLPFSGMYAQSHFDIESGQSLVLNLAAANEVDGFIRYRTEPDSGNY